MARSKLLEEQLNILLKQYAKGKIKFPTVEKELINIKKEVRKSSRGKRKPFILISRYEAIFKSLKNKKIKTK